MPMYIFQGSRPLLLLNTYIRHNSAAMYYLKDLFKTLFETRDKVHSPYSEN